MLMNRKKTDTEQTPKDNSQSKSPEKKADLN